MGSFEKAKQEKRSPIPQPSLPNPGESLSGLLLDRVWDIMFWAVVTLLVFVDCLVEWMHYLFRTPPSPFFMTAVFLALSAVAGWKIWQISREIPRLRLGIRGERTVGQLLETLRASGYRVFHDIVEDNYNIDHVVIGPAGVFAIDTKTISKPGRGKTEVVYDGESILVDGFAPDRDPIVQALAAARRVRAILKEQTGTDERVNPVVLYPRWFVSTTVKDAAVTVANETYFTNGLHRRDNGDRLSDERIALLAAGMDRYLRRPI